MTQSRATEEASTIPASAARSRLVRLLPLAVLLLLPFALFWRGTLGQRAFDHHDLQYYFFPYHKLVADLVRQGWPPLWNPYTLGGMPLWADVQTALFYPPNWLFLLFPPAHAMMLVILLQFSLAGAGMFLYLRQLRFTLFVATVGAFVFMFNGFMVVRVVHVMLLSGAALIPWLFWGLERVLWRKTWRPVVGMGLLVGLQLLAGHAQLPVYTAIGLGVYTLVMVARRGWRTRDARAAWPLVDLSIVYVIGVGLGAIQYLPWMAISPLSLRGAGVSYEYTIAYSLAGPDWLLYLFPYGYGGLQTGWPQTLPTTLQGYNIWERVGYIGLLPLALAVLGLLELGRRPAIINGDSGAAADQHRDRLWALAAMLVVMLLIAAGPTTPMARLLSMTPLLNSMRAHARAVGPAAFALITLAAYGLQRLGAASNRRPERAATPVGLLLLALMYAALVGVHLLNSGVPAGVTAQPWYADYRVSLGAALTLPQANAYWPLVLAAATAIVLTWSGRGLSRAAATALVALIAVDLLSFATTFNPMTDAAVFSRVPASVEFLRRDPTLYRVAPFIEFVGMTTETAQEQLAMSWSMAYNLEDIGGFNPLQTRRYTDLLFGSSAEEASYGILGGALLQPWNTRLLDMLDVKYALVQPGASVRPPSDWPLAFANEHVTIYENPQPLGRAVFVDQVRVASDADLILDRIQDPNFDPRREAWLEVGDATDGVERLSGSGLAQVEVERRGPNKLIIHTRTDAPRFLLLSEMWFPGWHAEVLAGEGEAGQPLTVHRVNTVFRGLAVPAGEFTIRLFYRPVSIQFGIVLTTLTLVACGLAWWLAGGGRASKPTPGRGETIPVADG